MDEKIMDTDYTECMKQSYINYSMSVIMSRALPDVRDGLKPVQRRTLYAMYELGLHYNQPHRKCARIVGDTMGKYHPHGDSSIYDALVVMAQDFKKQEPLADSHGNFGSIEGDGAAAMRYTEVRLKQLTEEVFLADLDKDIVDFKPNFDETEKEPEVLPVRIPNLLVNGAEGIAVGMATSIPSHNLSECIDCVKAMIENPQISTEELLRLMPGPDFSTGAWVVNQDELLSLYERGEGKIRLRGCVEIQKAQKASERDKVIITEIPYTMVGENLPRFLAELTKLVQNHTLDEVIDISNESSKEGIRIVLELQKNADVNRVCNILYQKTRLEDNLRVNMLAIADGKPVQLNLKSILRYHIAFQKELNTRKYHYLLKKEKQKLEIQEGLIRAVDQLDLIIEVIRGSKTQSIAKACLMGKPDKVNFRTKKSAKAAEKLCFTKAQAQAILDLRLSKLIGLEIIALEKDYQETLKNIKQYEKILSDDAVMQKTIISDLENIQKNFSHPRKTQIMQAQEIDKIEEKVVERDVVVLVDRFGYLKMLEAGYYKKNQNNMDKEYKHCIYTTNLSRLQIFTDIGKVHQISLEKLPYMKLKDKGIPIDNLSNYDSSREHFLYIRAMTQTESTQLLFVSASGWMKRVEALEYDTSYKTVMSMKLHPEDSLIYVGEASSPQLLLKTQKGYYLRFLTEEIELLHKNHFGKIGMELIAGDAIEWARSIDPQVDKTVDLPSGNVLEIKRVKLRKKGSKGMKLRL